MNAVLWGIALASSCLLQTAADLTVQPDFDPNKVVGVWNSVGVIMDQGKRPKNGFQLRMNVVNSGDMALTVQSIKYNCRKVVDYFVKTNQPGIYIRRGTTTTVSILDTDYKDYVIIHAKTPEQNLLRLYGCSETRFLEKTEAKYFHEQLALPMDTSIHKFRLKMILS
ncbi:epididymal secretory protein 4-like [Elgaria multicarinata webbii]|uniref:epididymal secretory protein 4-like n=1 Tax=Elgaria multicarinata webbii TaxID=159646 RepID=UPI002FCD1D61